jgi:hypothetical protein
MPSATPVITSAGTATRRLTRTLAVVAAVAIALVVWLIVDPLLGIGLEVPMAGGAQTFKVGWGSVLVVSLIASLAGWALLAVLERFAVRPRRTWTATALAALLLSFAGPLVAAGEASSGTRVALVLMHAAVAAVLIPWLAETSHNGRGAPAHEGPPRRRPMRDPLGAEPSSVDNTTTRKRVPDELLHRGGTGVPARRTATGSPGHGRPRRHSSRDPGGVEPRPRRPRHRGRRA